MITRNCYHSNFIVNLLFFPGQKVFELSKKQSDYQLNCTFNLISCAALSTLLSNMLLKILTVAGLATFEIYAAIPTGFALGLPSWIIFLASVTGGLTGAFVAAFLGDKISSFFNRKHVAEK